MRNLGVLALCLFVFGCANRGVISDISDSSVNVQSNLFTSSAGLQRTAEEGCAIYNKRPVPLSYTCLDGYCTRKRHLFACKEVENSNRGEPSSGSSASSRTGVTSNNSMNVPVVTPWNGEWKGQKGPWNLYMKIDGDRVAGRILSGSEPHDIIGVIGPEGRIRARVGNTINTTSTEIVGPMPALSLYINGQHATDINMSRTH